MEKTYQINANERSGKERKGKEKGKERRVSEEEMR